jgi:tRNA 2-selenouridine synthase
MFNTVTVEQALLMADGLFIDMRSPLEFVEGHLPGAVNIPVFDNEERIEVGTLYKQVGGEEAKARGLEIASVKLPNLVQHISQLAKRQNVIVYCWRGGMRSRSIATILDLMGIQVYQLTGGYKAYRSYVLASLHNHRITPRLVVLHGHTGVGKTTILQMLAQRAMPTIDLESLANHRGSVFGHIGKGPAATAKNFDTELLTLLEKYQHKPYIIVEAESKRIGNIYLPDCLFQAMQTGWHVLITASKETRINRLLEEYLQEDQVDMSLAVIVQSLETLQTRLGKAKVKMLQDLVMQGEYRRFVEILLVEYYDPLYKYDDPHNTKFDLSISSEDMTKATDQIIKFLNEVGGKI